MKRDWFGSPNFRERCTCGRFIKMSGRYGWEEVPVKRHTEIRYICDQCLGKGITPKAIAGGHCGVVERR